MTRNSPFEAQDFSAQDLALHDRARAPLVGRDSAPLGMALGIGFALAAGAMVFMGLSSARDAAAKDKDFDPHSGNKDVAIGSQMVVAGPAGSLNMALSTPISTGLATPTGPLAEPAMPETPYEVGLDPASINARLAASEGQRVDLTSAQMSTQRILEDPQQDMNASARLRAPVMVFDVPQPEEADETQGPDRPRTNPGGTTLTPNALTSAIGGMGPSVRSADETFGARFGVEDTNTVAIARMATNLSVIVPQGAIVPATLETAINSDLPGFVRAVVARDVLSFDGSQVLVPRGSRLIGQYKSGLTQGQRRAYVIWTRLVRPDGVSVDLGSPGADELGRGGLEGDIDTHFLQRFGGAILMSLIGAGLDALDDDNSTQIVINESRRAISGDTTGFGADAARGPTLTIDQGTPVRVFVARDLDFSRVLAP